MMNVKSSWQYNTIVIGMVASALSTVGLFNLIIDPYGVVGGPLIQKVNESKPKRLGHHRLVKAIDVQTIKPKTIFLGTSTALRLSINHPALNKSQPVYNLGLPGASMYEIKRYFQHSLVNQPELKNVVIGLDFFSFSQGVSITDDFMEERLEKKEMIWKDRINILLSMTAFSDSYFTLNKNLSSNTPTANELQNATFAEAGALNDKTKTKDKTLKNFEGVIYSYFQKEDRYKNYQLSSSQLAHLQAIVDECRARNIQLKIFFSPIHAVQAEAIQRAGLWSHFEQWKREVVKITPVWDFATHNRITTESVNSRMKNFVDGTHYQYEIADLILNRLFQHQVKTVPADFGTFLTPKTIEPHLATIRQKQTTWRDNNVEMITFVDQLYQKAHRY